ncbi:hypothetical protein BDD43_4650 [Mucilaginibacter gracilis]|uniref:Uncharacterized protein n=2 Tax=Mucilaginibacter gracilis TaxID=423350 RepID=A0A495J611_9SPHI|nr:hypothetical protein BDD43_4650 [Mucilaginibacter gracilis]
MALALTIGVAGAFATKAASHKSTAGVNYYWYDPSTGALLDPASSPTPPNGCPDEGTIECARGFVNQTDNPQGDTPDRIVNKLN